MNIRVMSIARSSQHPEPGAEVFHYTAEVVPAVGDLIIWSGERMEVMARTWHIGLDGIPSVVIWVEVG